MTIILSSDLEASLIERARRQGISPEELIVNTLREKFAPNGLPFEPRDEWERGLLAIARDCGIGVPNEALSSEGLYE